MKTFLLIATLSLMLIISCHKDGHTDSPVEHPDTTVTMTTPEIVVGPRDTTGLQGRKWYQDSMIVTDTNNVIVNRTYSASPNYLFIVYYPTNYKFYSYNSGIRSIDSVNCQFQAPDRLYIWFNGTGINPDFYLTIQLVTDSSLVMYRRFNFQSRPTKWTYYSHAGN